MGRSRFSLASALRDPETRNVEEVEMSGQQASYDQFLARYNNLKALYFSPRSNPQYDEDGEEIPSPFMGKSQICKIFLEEMRVQVPSHRQDPPTFLDGRVGPSSVDQPTASVPAPPILSAVDPELAAFQARQRAEQEEFFRKRQQAEQDPPVPV